MWAELLQTLWLPMMECNRVHLLPLQTDVTHLLHFSKDSSYSADYLQYHSHVHHLWVTGGILIDSAPPPLVRPHLDWLPVFPLTPTLKPVNHLLHADLQTSGDSRVVQTCGFGVPATFLSLYCGVWSTVDRWRTPTPTWRTSSCSGAPTSTNSPWFSVLRT